MKTHTTMSRTQEIINEVKEKNGKLSYHNERTGIMFLCNGNEFYRFNKDGDLRKYKNIKSWAKAIITARNTGK